MPDKNVLQETFDPDSEALDLQSQHRKAEYWVFGLLALLLVPWFLGVIAIARGVLRFLHH